MLLSWLVRSLILCTHWNSYVIYSLLDIDHIKEEGWNKKESVERQNIPRKSDPWSRIPIPSLTWVVVITKAHLNHYTFHNDFLNRRIAWCIDSLIPRSKSSLGSYQNSNHSDSRILRLEFFQYLWVPTILSTIKNVDYKFVDKICRKKICRFDKFY
jgi:hypothetical protein